MAKVIPILRIFDYDKAIEFYVTWLGFKIVWEHSPENAPLYMEVALGDVILHLTEHHGDCTPGARVFIADYSGLEVYHKLLIDKQYKFNRPGLEHPFYNPEGWLMEVIDPFGNRLTFNEG